MVDTARVYDQYVEVVESRPWEPKQRVYDQYVEVVLPAETGLKQYKQYLEVVFIDSAGLIEGLVKRARLVDPVLFRARSDQLGYKVVLVSPLASRLRTAIQTRLRVVSPTMTRARG